jgi:hypothetical protein
MPTSASFNDAHAPRLMPHRETHMSPSRSRSSPERLVAAMALVVAVTMPAPSLSHSWYPSWCCGGEDCKQVDEIEYLPDGSMLVHAGLMHVVVPQGFFLQPSPVDQAHVCA